MTGARAQPRSPRRWASPVPRCTGTCPSRLPASCAVRHAPGRIRLPGGYDKGQLYRPAEFISGNGSDVWRAEPEWLRRIGWPEIRLPFIFQTPPPSNAIPPELGARAILQTSGTPGLTVPHRRNRGRWKIDAVLFR